jgi:AcrR family transcriptional regulator
MICMYHSPRRADAAAATHAAILDNARTMFLDRGYTDVTVGDIAKAAQVAVPTVYASTGGKAAILAALLRPIVEDPSVEATLAAMAAAGDATRVIDVTAAGIRLTCERHWDTIHGLLLNAPAEPAAKVVIKAAMTSYLDALTAVAERLVVLDALRPGIDRDQALDLLWFYLGQNAWFTLVGERGWAFDRAEEWLAGAARQALLGEPAR